MGGGSKQERDRKHVPYSSVRKLFYDYSDEIDQPKKAPRDRRTENRARRSSDIPFSAKMNATGANGLLQKKSRRASEGMFMRPINKSIHFRGSYSDFYCEHDSNLTDVSWLSCSENKLNRQTVTTLRRFQSLDPDKFTNINTPLSSLEDISQEDANSCYKYPIDEEEDAGDQIEVEKEDESPKEESDFEAWECQAFSQSTFSLYWISAAGSPFHDFPWIRRAKRHKNAHAKVTHRRPSACSDFVRTTELESKVFLHSSQNDNIYDVNPVDDARTDLRFPLANPTHLMTFVRHSTGIRICDGYFGCP